MCLIENDTKLLFLVNLESEKQHDRPSLVLLHPVAVVSLQVWRWSKKKKGHTQTILLLSMVPLPSFKFSVVEQVQKKC